MVKNIEVVFRKGTIKGQKRKKKIFCQYHISRPNGKYFLPPASYTLTAEEKKIFCQYLRGVRVPTGFLSNISKLVSMNDLSMYG
jgi:hypothetical protein